MHRTFDPQLPHPAKLPSASSGVWNAKTCALIISEIVEGLDRGTRLEDASDIEQYTYNLAWP